MNTFLYFAYGSNMLTPHLAARCPSAKAVSQASASNFQIGFWKKSVDGSGKATLAAAGPKRSAHGVLFELGIADLPALDRAEGVGKGYNRRDDFAVIRADTGETVEVTTYIASELNQKLRPYDWYLALAVAGALEQGLDGETLTTLKTTPFHPDPDSERPSRREALRILEDMQIDYRTIIGGDPKASSPQKDFEARRSIKDAEIVLIKAMIRRGMKNKDIQFLFNRPDRSVNAGRISGIQAGTYSNSAAIEPASEADLDAFLSNFQPTDISALVNVPVTAKSPEDVGPVSASTLRAMFQNDKTRIWRFRHGETDRHECKTSFGLKYADKWLRAIAGLANNHGGYVFFGVKDKSVVDGKLSQDSYKVVGLENCEFENADPADFSKRIKAFFDPTPRVESAVLDLDGLKVGVLYVHQHHSRPVVATRNDGTDVKEGDIYFRYPGQSTRIKYSDLRAILDDRDRQSREQILPMVERLLTLGPRDAMVADLAGGMLSDGKRTIIIGEDLLDRIKFIREGEFKENEGSPTLRLVGDVQAVDAKGSVIRKGFVTPADLVREFLDMESPYDPKEYIRCAIEGGNGAWLPMHYYARKADLIGEELAEFIMTTSASLKRREMYRDRARGVISAFHAAGGEAASFLAQLRDGKLPDIKNVNSAANLGRAVAGLKAKPKANLNDILTLIKTCTDIIQSSNKPSWMSTIRRGIARLDELYFKEIDRAS